jgi:hypothetical protein
MNNNDVDFDFDNEKDYGGNIISNNKDDLLLAVRSKIIDILQKQKDIHHVNINTSEFYSFDILSSGKKYLVTKMAGGKNNISATIFDKLTDDEVNCQIMISDFVRTLYQHQQQEFGTLMDHIMIQYIDNKETSVCSVPRSFADVRRLYVDGVDSVTKHLPIPDVKELAYHSYVSVLDCVADFLYSNHHRLRYLSDLKDDNKLDVNDLSLFNTQRFWEIIDVAKIRQVEQSVTDDSNIVVLFFKLWSDDFDPNSSSKSNRQSVWVKTLSIFTLTEGGRKVTYTYPIATSKKM